MRTRLHATLLALLLAASSNVASQGTGGTLLVANRTGGSISLFDLATGVDHPGARERRVDDFDDSPARGPAAAQSGICSSCFAASYPGNHLLAKATPA